MEQKRLKFFVLFWLMFLEKVNGGYYHSLLCAKRANGVAKANDKWTMDCEDKIEIGGKKQRDNIYYCRTADTTDGIGPAHVYVCDAPTEDYYNKFKTCCKANAKGEGTFINCNVLKTPCQGVE